jgi:integrase
MADRHVEERASTVGDAAGGHLRGRAQRRAARRSLPERPVFVGVTGDRLRTRLTKACIAAGVPSFSPHDLRHRRVSLLHLGGMPWARIGELVGHDDITTTSRVYTHVVTDEREIDYKVLLDA